MHLIAGQARVVAKIETLMINDAGILIAFGSTIGLAVKWLFGDRAAENWTYFHIGGLKAADIMLGNIDGAADNGYSVIGD